MNPRIWASTFVIGFVATAPLLADTLKVPQQFTTIQAAVDAAVAGDEVVISKGHYAGDISITGKTDVTVRGKGKVIINGSPFAAGFAPPGVIYMAGCTRTVLRGIEVRAAVDHQGIRIDGCTDCVLDRCRVKGCSNGFSSSLGTGLSLARCETVDTFGDGFLVSVTSAEVAGCKVTRAGGAGFRISVDSGEVRGNTVNGADQNGISLVGDGVVVVSDNRLSGIAQVAIDVDDHIVGYLSRNVVKGANQGIAAFGDALVVDGNSIGNVANQGIECFNPNLTTSRNRFNRCGRGILVGAFSDGCTHVENVVKRSGGNGLELEIGAADNLFRGNTVKQSRGFDLLDSSGSANGFIANSFGTVGP